MRQYRHHHGEPRNAGSEPSSKKAGDDETPGRHGQRVLRHDAKRRGKRHGRANIAVEQQRNETTLMASTRMANKSPTPLPTTISVQPWRVVNTSVHELPIEAGGA